MKTQFIHWLCILLLASGCGGSQEETSEPAGEAEAGLTGTLTICGADALKPLMLIWSAEFMQLHPGLTLEVSGGGTGLGISLLQEGKIDIAMVSRRISPGERRAGRPRRRGSSVIGFHLRIAPL